MQIAKMPWTASGPSGEAVQVTRHGGYMGFESPDGKFLYYSKFGSKPSLWKVPADGGEETQVIAAMMHAYFAVTKAGIYYIGGPDREARPSIRFFSFATRRTSPVLALHGLPSAGITVSPDGRTLLYAQIDQQRSDLRLVENFR